MKIEIQGRDAVKATEELLAIEGFEGSYETVSEVEREGTLVTIATIVAITSGTLTIAEKLYQWNQKYQKSLQEPAGARIEKVLLVAPNGNRLLLKDATVEQIQEILED
jgi:cysteine synthase